MGSSSEQKSWLQSGPLVGCLLGAAPVQARYLLVAPLPCCKGLLSTRSAEGSPAQASAE